MSQQWRLRCEECGNPDVENLRMHSQLTKNEAAEVQRRTDKIRDEADLDSATWVECNVCGDVKRVG